MTVDIKRLGFSLIGYSLHKASQTLRVLAALCVRLAGAWGVAAVPVSLTPSDLRSGIPEGCSPAAPVVFFWGRKERICGI